MSDVRLVLEVVAAAFAVRAYRHHPSRPLWLLRCGFVCLAVTHVATLLFSGLALFAFPQLSDYGWVYYADALSVSTFLVLSIFSFHYSLREVSASSTLRPNQAMQPTAGRSEAES